MANFYNNFLFNDITFLLNPFPNFINLLDNFRLIHYRGTTVPRIGLNENYYKKMEELKIRNKEDSETEINNSIESNNNKDIYIPIKNENIEQEIDNNESNLEKKITEKSLDYNNKLFYNSKNLFYKNNNCLYELELKLKEKKSFEPIPPKSFISIINDGTNLKNDKDNYDKINKIILNNINIISNEENIPKNNNTALIQNIINKINNQTILNINFQLNPNFSQNKDLSSSSSSSSNFSKKKCYKHLFTIFSEQQELLKKKRKIHLKRGRKENKENNKNKRTHSASDDDNILRKIQVHFLSFIVNYVNDVIRTIIEDKNAPLFKNLDYKIKKRVNHKFIEELKKKNISEILQFEISPKIKKYDKKANKEIYLKICKICPYMTEFLQQNYLTLFKEYYYNKNKTFEVNGKMIQLSEKTKVFNDLILKNSQHKEKLKYVAINYFLNTYKRMKKPNFITCIFENQ